MTFLKAISAFAEIAFALSMGNNSSRKELFFRPYCPVLLTFAVLFPFFLIWFIDSLCGSVLQILLSVTE